MIDISGELKEEVVTDLFDLLFAGRGKEMKTVGGPGSVSPEDLSRKVLVRGLLEEEITEVEEEIKNEVLEGKNAGDSSLKGLIRLARTWKAMKLLSSDDPDEEIPQVFLLDSLFLKECHESLSPYKKEEEIFLTGVRTGKLNVPTKKLEFETKATGQKVEDIPLSSYKTLKSMSNYGMPFLGAFHSHPNSGRPRPSNTDLQQFGKYEDHGYKVLGAVFTERGYVRFFTKDLDFEVLLTGKRVERIEGGLFRLES